MFRGLECSSSQAVAILLGGQPWLLTAVDEHEAPYTALGVLVRGRLRCRLGVTLAAPAPPAFWAGLRQFFRRHDVTEFWVESIDTLDSTGSIPTFPNERERFANIKLYVVNLQGDTSLDRMATSHRRNIMKARRNGIELVELPEAEALVAQTCLANSSMARRKGRGEPIRSKPYTEKEIARHLTSGKARIYQASLCGHVVSSNLVVVLGECAHYLIGGTSEEGMRVGASHYLMHQIICTLKANGTRTLNLDIAAARTGGLDRFKEGWGAETFYLERAYFDLPHSLKLFRNFARHFLQ